MSISNRYCYSSLDFINEDWLPCLSSWPCLSPSVLFAFFARTLTNWIGPVSPPQFHLQNWRECGGQFNIRANAETAVTNLYRFVWSQYNLYFLYNRHVKLKIVLRDKFFIQRDILGRSIFHSFFICKFFGVGKYKDVKYSLYLILQNCVYYAMKIIRKTASFCKCKNVSGPLHKALQAADLNWKLYNFKLFVTAQNIKYRPSYKLKLLF